MEFIKVCDQELYSVFNNITKKTTYNICKSNNSRQTFYGIQITTYAGNEKHYDIMENISTDMELVLKIINCLSQNGVDSICFKDVVKDLMLEI